MNHDLKKLHAYPFEKLRDLKAGVTPVADKSAIFLSIGEPKHPLPELIRTRFSDAVEMLSQYPRTLGELPLRSAIAHWLQQRFQLPAGYIDPERHVLPVNGTREALFAFAQAVVDRRDHPVVLMPNPFYQIYEGAALLAGAEPVYLNTVSDNDFVPDFERVPESVWQRCQLIYLCSPGNPTGAVISDEQMEKLIELAHRYDFIIASDECYSELYLDETQPPGSLLSVAAKMGHDDFSRCVVFHSLSKRSNAPGLRSGFVAGDAKVIAAFLKYRTYHGCAMSLPIQMASVAAWEDEEHVVTNRQLYREKFAAVLEILSGVLNVSQPQGGFYLWPQLPMSDEKFCRELFARENVTVLPGRYLSRQADGVNPGEGYVRIALVATLQECVDAATRIKTFMNHI